ncbi:hypothetical protein [Polyangium aurulentum]|uniref:hypothetical protein n=1 Tax=Polyangium aurulentum TaxID=2567896 RepID=UPI0010AE857A|nr:hypothetical protein [Polyangium aurulentum]UQA59613.1 hypothetical protein E8A73_003640 [Polyangium aurulentum]
MADTIVDPIEPVPPTQREPASAPAPEPAAEPAPAPPPKRPLSRASIVAIAVASVVVFVAIGAVGLWFFVLRYVPTARAHVPAGTNIAIRLEAADIVLFGPVRKHLVDTALGNEATADAPSTKKKSRAARIEDRTGVRLPADVREILIASMDGKSWVALVGGRIERGKFVDGLAEVAREEGWAGYRKENGILVGPNMAIAQAEDGTIVVGTDRAIVQTALPATEEGQKLGLPEKGAVTFAIGKGAWEAIGSGKALVPGASSLPRIERATGSFKLGSAPELSMRLEPASAADRQALEDGLRALLAQMNLVMLLAPDTAGEKEAMRAAVVRGEGNAVVLQAPWPYEGIDRGCAKIASFLRGAGGDGAAAPIKLP